MQLSKSQGLTARDQRDITSSRQYVCCIDLGETQEMFTCLLLESNSIAWSSLFPSCKSQKKYHCETIIDYHMML